MMLECIGLSKTYRMKQAVAGISLRLEEGQREDNVDEDDRRADQADFREDHL